METIKQFFEEGAKVESAPVEMDKLGVDYIVSIGRAKIFIDIKHRESRSGTWILHDMGPKIALESWSKIPIRTKIKASIGRIGWTMDSEKISDYILYTYEPSVTDECFIFPFHLLRKAFIKNLEEWKKEFPLRTQDNGHYDSECMFVPARIVQDAIKKISEGKTVKLAQQEPA